MLLWLFLLFVLALIRAFVVFEACETAVADKTAWALVLGLIRTLGNLGSCYLLTLATFNFDSFYEFGFTVLELWLRVLGFSVNFLD